MNESIKKEYEIHANALKAISDKIAVELKDDTIVTSLTSRIDKEDFKRYLDYVKKNGFKYNPSNKTWSLKI